MKIFKIYEIFNTMNFKWLKYPFGKKAYFKINNDKYFIHFDEISTNVFNHYFYLKNGDEMFFNILNDKKPFKILSNIKHCLDSFLENNTYVRFIGFSSDDESRINLYTLYSQYIKRKNLNNLKIINKKDKNYYFIYSSEMPKSILNNNIEKFIKEENKKH
jgi:hypothetical protein